MKLLTKFTVPKNSIRALDYVKKMQILEKKLNQSCIDYL